MTANLRAEFEAFREVSERKRGPKCTACRIKEKSPDLIAAAEDLLNEGAMQTTVADWLETKGIDISAHNLGEHWRKHVQGRK